MGTPTSTNMITNYVVEGCFRAPVIFSKKHKQFWAEVHGRFYLKKAYYVVFANWGSGQPYEAF